MRFIDLEKGMLVRKKGRGPGGKGCTLKKKGGHLPVKHVKKGNELFLPSSERGLICSHLVERGSSWKGRGRVVGNKVKKKKIVGTDRVFPCAFSYHLSKRTTFTRNSPKPQSGRTGVVVTGEKGRFA